MIIIEKRQEPVPAKRPLESITLILSRDEVECIQRYATTAHDKVHGIQGSSIVVELVERIQKVGLLYENLL